LAKRARNRLDYTLRLITPFLVGFLLALFEGSFPVQTQGWYLFCILSATILGIILKPLPMGAVTLIGLCVATCTSILDIGKEALTGFSSPIIWLIVFVFFIARGLVKTQLSTRIAYLFVYFLGKRTLGLGYGLVLTELIIAPMIPSNVARTGGIMFPILKAISESLGSTPEKGTEKNLGCFLTQVCFQGNLITSAMFITAMAANPLIQSLAAKQGVFITWSSWLLASSVPGVLSIIIIPLILYFICPPLVKEIPEAPLIAQRKLKEMGAVKQEEWMVISIFVLMLTLWIGGEKWGINPSVTALLGVCLLLVTKVITWDDMLREREAWHTLVWLSILVMMSGYLEKFGLIAYFSKTISILVSGWHWFYAFLVLSLTYFYSHYLLAGNVAHVGSMYAAFLTALIITGSPPYLAALMLAFFSSLFSSMTHYGTGSAAILYGGGYVPILTWWRIGLIISFVNIVIWLGIGSMWWKVLGFW